MKKIKHADDTILNQYNNCRSVRHECFLFLETVLLKDIVDIITNYCYIASPTIFNDLAAQYLQRIQNPKECQQLDLISFTVFNSIWGNVLYKIKVDFKREVQNVLVSDYSTASTNFGVYIADLVTRYVHKYALVTDLFTTNKTVVKELCSNYDYGELWFQLENPDSFLQKVLKLFEGKGYGHGDLIYFSDWRAQGLCAILYVQETDLFKIVSATDDKSGSEYEMSTDLLPLIKNNPKHLEGTSIEGVFINGRSYYLLSSNFVNSKTRRTVIDGIQLCVCELDEID